MARAARPKRLCRSADRSSEDDWPPLSRAQTRELRRRVADLDDRTRYLLVSVFSRRFALYYDVSQDVWAMNDPSSGTLFKRRSAAKAVQGLLRDGILIVPCRVNRRSRLIKASIRLGLRPRGVRRTLRHA
jgi:hypothetical protein